MDAERDLPQTQEDRPEVVLGLDEEFGRYRTPAAATDGLEEAIHLLGLPPGLQDAAAQRHPEFQFQDVPAGPEVRRRGPNRSLEVGERLPNPLVVPDQQPRLHLG